MNWAFLGIVAFTVVLLVLLRIGAPSPRAKPYDSGLILSYGPMMTLLGSLSLLLFGANVGRSGYLFATRGGGQNLAFALMSLALCVGALWFLAEAQRVTFIISEKGIERRAGRKSVVLPWPSVTRVLVDRQGWSVLLEGSGGQRLLLSLMLSGVGGFAEVALRRLPETVLRELSPDARALLEGYRASA